MAKEEEKKSELKRLKDYYKHLLLVEKAGSNDIDTCDLYREKHITQAKINKLERLVGSAYLFSTDNNQMDMF